MKTHIKGKKMSNVQGIYKDTNGGYFEVLGSAITPDTLDKFIIYQELNGNYDLFVMPQHLFEGVEIVHGEFIPRYQLVDEVPGTQRYTFEQGFDINLLADNVDSYQ